MPVLHPRLQEGSKKDYRYGQTIQPKVRWLGLIGSRKRNILLGRKVKIDIRCVKEFLSGGV